MDAKIQNDPVVKGRKPGSGHYRFVNGVLVEVFYAYHWIVREDGRTERLLDDREVGWHSGSWAENMRSIAIVFDGDFSKKPPPDKAIKAAAKLLQQYTQQFPITRLKGHFDVRKTECPGAWYKEKYKEPFSWARITGRPAMTGRERLLKYAKVFLSE